MNAKRDWGHAKAYVEAMWLILQQQEPEDYVIATGETYEVREFVRLAFEELGIDVKDMVASDLKEAMKIEYLKKGGYRTLRSFE